MVLLRKAIKEWDVPLELQRPLMEAALSPLHREDTPARMVLAIARLVLAADRHILEEELADAKLRTLPKPVKPVDDPRSAAPWPPPAPEPVGMLVGTWGPYCPPE